MKNVFRAVKVTDRLWWVGAIDWAVRDFHGYSTHRGTTYNAFLLMADPITLFDTVKASFYDEMLARIASVVDPAKVRCIVSNHAEPDHTGELPHVIDALKPETVYASASGAAALEQYYRIGSKITVVKDGQCVKLGDRSVVFAETKMCHWPDSMVSYLPEEKTLISQDAFGMHLAGYERFDDQVAPDVLRSESAKYYANILLPLSKFVAKGVEKVAAAGWDMQIIAPDHGPIWRTDKATIVNDYVRWAQQKRTNKAVVVYDTMWKSTARMAAAVGEGLTAGGARAKLLPLSSAHRSDVATELLDAGGLVVGAPTINNEMFPTMADCLTYIRGLKPVGLVGGAFGSFGWGGEATKHLTAMLADMKVEMPCEPVRSKYTPTDADLKSCYELGLVVAAKLPGGV